MSLSGVIARTVLLQVENHCKQHLGNLTDLTASEEPHLRGPQLSYFTMQLRWDYPNEYIVGAWEPKTSNHK